MIHWDAMQIDPPMRRGMREFGLDRVEAVLATPGDRLAAWSRTTDTIQIHARDGSPGLFIKRYHYPRWSNRFRGAFRGTLLGSSRARREFRTLSLMRRLGIQAVRPIAFGEHRVWGFVRSCFLITEAVPDAISLSSFITAFGPAASTNRDRIVRVQILTSLALQVRHMHDRGFMHQDLFWRNVLIRSLPDDRFEFYFLDASVGKRIRLAQRRHDSIIRDIAAMGVMAPQFCTRSDQVRFLLAYLGRRRLATEDRTWIRRVQQHSVLLRETEVTRLKRGSVFDPPIHELAGTA